MKRAENLAIELRNLPHFSKSTVFQLGKELGLAPSSINTYISRLLKRNKIISLKKGLYVSSDFYHIHQGDISYKFYLSNLLRQPSYVSSWAALQYYNLATEATYPITCVTNKVTREYRSKIGNFTYQSIKKELFSDFLLIEGRFPFFIATPAKALFDLLYFRTQQFRSTDRSELRSLIEELRIDLEEIGEDEQARFYKLINTHFHE